MNHRTAASIAESLTEAVRYICVAVVFGIFFHGCWQFEIARVRPIPNSELRTPHS